jgi:hypothetical protein
MIRLAAVLLASFGTGVVCNVPVFRYALERWPSELYEALVFHRGPLDAEGEKVLKELRESEANLAVERIDLAGKLDPAVEKIWKGLGDPSLPCLAIRYPRTEPEVPVAWKGPLTSESVVQVSGSPARRELVRRIVSGDSAVWLFLESGDEKKDDAAAGFLRDELGKLEKELKLPKTAEEDPPLLSPVPLKLAFSVLRVSRTDPAEKAFVSVLLNSDPELAAAKEPVAFPIFGRARAVWPLTGKTFTAEYFGEVGAYITGACSCEAKQLNPGLDLLVAADWEKALLTPPIQPLEMPKPVIAPGPAAPPAPAPVPPPASPPLPPPPARSRGPIWLAVGAAGLLVLWTGARALRRG